MNQDDDPNDTLKPWARWLLNHKMKWIVIVLAWVSLPVYFFSYLPDAFNDIRIAIRNLK